MIGSRSHSWWGMVVLMLVDGTIFACLVFAYFYLWTITPSGWPPAPFDLPSAASSVLAALAWLASSGLIAIAHRRLCANAGRGLLCSLLLAATTLLAVAFTLTLQALSGANVRPDQHAYGAVIFTMLSWQGLHAVLLLFMSGYTIARSLAGMIDAVRRNTFDNTRLMWHYTVVQGLIALAVMHSPRVFS